MLRKYLSRGEKHAPPWSPPGLQAGWSRRRAREEEGELRPVQNLDLAARSWGASQPCVGGQQARTERFGERDIDRVVDRQIVAQLPDPRPERRVRVAPHRQQPELVPRLANPALAE